jgi:type IV secretory pathway VirB10-like protein
MHGEKKHMTTSPKSKTAVLLIAAALTAALSACSRPEDQVEPTPAPTTSAPPAEAGLPATGDPISPPTDPSVPQPTDAPTPPPMEGAQPVDPAPNLPAPTDDEASNDDAVG